MSKQAIEYGTVDTLDAGMEVILGQQHLLQHLLVRAGYGWCITKYAGGSRGLEQTEHFGQDEAKAREVFSGLRR